MRPIKWAIAVAMLAVPVVPLVALGLALLARQAVQATLNGGYRKAAAR